MVSAIILATGSDTIEEQKLLQGAIESARASEIHEIICVVRDLETVRRRITLTDKQLYWLRNPAPDQRQSSSVIAGLWAIDPKSDGALYLPTGEPTIRTDLINSLVEHFENTNALIVAPSLRGQIHDPILFRRDLFPKLLQLTGHRDGRELIEKYRKKTALVEWNDDGVDINIPGDDEKIKAVD